MPLIGTEASVDPAFVCRHDVPSGAVPEYREFVRRVWAWRDEDGRSCIDAPPWMFSVVIQDPIEVSLVSSLLSSIHQLRPFDGRFEVLVLEDGSEFSFADIAVLHIFLRSLASLSAVNETARRVCEYVMWMLGFRWV